LIVAEAEPAARIRQAACPGPALAGQNAYAISTSVLAIFGIAAAPRGIHNIVTVFEKHAGPGRGAAQQSSVVSCLPVGFGAASAASFFWPTAQAAPSLAHIAIRSLNA
jgi:hypothetical protein